MSTTESEETAAIVLFDGVCNLCSGAVQWVIRHDKKGYFKFASLQSNIGEQLKSRYNIPPGVDSIVLIENNKAFVKSTAVLRIAKHSGGAWKLGYVFMVVPAVIRNWIYDIIARKRYRWFGKKNVCWIPDASLMQRFLE